MNKEAATTDAGMYVVTLRKVRATWYYFTTNPQGGGFGSNLCGSQSAALRRAVENLPAGTCYRLVVNERDRGVQVRQ